MNADKAYKLNGTEIEGIGAPLNLSYKPPATPDLVKSQPQTARTTPLYVGNLATRLARPKLGVLIREIFEPHGAISSVELGG